MFSNACHFRLQGDISKDCCSLCENGRHHKCFGGGDAYKFKSNVGADKFFAFCFQSVNSVFLGKCRAHFLKSVHEKVDRPRADNATARMRERNFSETSENRTSENY